jgi:hypothetical protein
MSQIIIYKVLRGPGRGPGHVGASRIVRSAACFIWRTAVYLITAEELDSLAGYRLCERRAGGATQVCFGAGGIFFCWTCRHNGTYVFICYLVWDRVSAQRLEGLVASPHTHGHV